LVSKAAYDGAGRRTKSYTTDGGGDTSRSDAGNVTGDAVLTQTTLQYDSVSAKDPAMAPTNTITTFTGRLNDDLRRYLGMDCLQGRPKPSPGQSSP
jgi:hypothetical protein